MLSPHSFSGALQENLLNLQASSLTSSFATWQQQWMLSQTKLRTLLNNPALYFTAFGYHHPLMPMTEPFFITTQILLHRLMVPLRSCGSLMLKWIWR